jgi:hypothetical protein
MHQSPSNSVELFFIVLVTVSIKYNKSELLNESSKDTLKESGICLGNMLDGNL